jgi:hypothetical protein
VFLEDSNFSTACFYLILERSIWLGCILYSTKQYRYSGSSDTRDKKVRLSLYLISSVLRHEDILVSGGISPPLLTSALDGGQMSWWSASLSYGFTPGKRSPGTHWIGEWVDPGADLDLMEKGKPLLVSGIEPSLPARSLSLCRLSYPGP